MNTVASSDRKPRKPRTRSLAVRIVLRTALGLTLALLLLAAGLFLYARRSLPALSGEQVVSGIAGDVEIVRDAHAVPHIYAKTREDAYFGLGYVHAQDRLWQLELHRRVGSGTLSELVGSRALPSDRLFRTLGLRRIAEQGYGALDDATRAMVEAYARGVNAFRAEGHPLPPEFALTGSDFAPWKPSDSMLFLKLMAWQLSANWDDELRRVRLGAQLTPARLAEFAPAYPGDAPFPFEALFRVYEGLDLSLRPAQHTDRGPAPTHPMSRVAALAGIADALLPLAPSAPAQAIGSNNWAVDGSRTASGKPLLANDPHLALSAPSQWYLAHLEAPDLSVVGATLPSLPGVILGRNQRVAWAFTNMQPDTQDLYLERVRADAPDQYEGPEGARAFERTREVIRVKDGDDVTLWVRRTRHGPVISDVSTTASALLPDGYVLALSWTGLRTDDHTLAFPIRAALARDAAGLREAARAFHAPAQNIVFADVAGSIGFVAAGRIPLRRDDAALQGLLPAPGWLAAYDWTGEVAFDALPQLAQPASGRIVTANQRVAAADYPHFLGADWSPPYRHDRIVALLDAAPAHTRESFAAMQRDLHSTIAARMLPAMLAALSGGGALDGPEREVAEALTGWDRVMRAEQAEPLLFSAWLRELSRAIYEDELGPSFADERSARPEFLEAVLRDVDGQARWCDDRRTATQETCPVLARAALSRALADLRARFGEDRARWSWGAAHHSVAAHRLLGGVPGLGQWFNLSVPRGGDSSTIDVGSYVLDDEDVFRNDWGPGLRAIYDLADLERSVAILNTGQSGHVLSPHYRDMHAHWAEGRHVPLVTTRHEVERGALGTLRLVRAH